jgi:hypothetical protein
MTSSFLVALGFFIAAKQGMQLPSHVTLIITVAITTIVWVVATLVAKPTDPETLKQFCRLVKPAGPGWSEVRKAAGVEGSPDSLTQSLLGWVLGCTFVYAALFGAGSFLFGKTAQGVMWLALFVVSGAGLLRVLPRMLGNREVRA